MVRVWASRLVWGRVGASRFSMIRGLPSMARTTTFTQAQLEAAKNALDQLPDLSRDKIGKAEFLVSLKDQIVMLAKNKGYNTGEIKSALSSVGLEVSTKAISEILSAPQKRRSQKNNGVKVE